MKKTKSDYEVRVSAVSFEVGYTDEEGEFSPRISEHIEVDLLDKKSVQKLIKEKPFLKDIFAKLIDDLNNLYNGKSI